MAERRRTYGDQCGIARALDVIGERWALLVVRELILGPKRFTDLRAGLPNVGPDVLSQRLRELDAAGLIRRRTLPPPASARVYELTERGAELEPVVLALGRWGSGAPMPDGEASMSPDSIMLALKTMYDPAASRGAEGTYELAFGPDRFAVTLNGGALEIVRGPAGHPLAALETEPGVLAQLIWHGLSLARAKRDGRVVTAGDEGALRRLLGVFV